MRYKYVALLNLVRVKKTHPHLRQYVSVMIFKWAKDESLQLSEFAWLINKALNYIR